MKIVFMGTPDFAVPCLQALIESEHEVAAVFTQPDKPVGRKHILTPPPVKVCAFDNDIPVYQPESVKKDDTALNIIKDIAPDIIVVVAYGKLLPSEILSAAPYGCINIHASLLPKYRGASPVQWAIVCGEKVTGVTAMQLDEGMDTGDILLMRECEIGDNDTAIDMFDKLSKLGADVLVDTLSKLGSGEITPIKQDNDIATYAPIIEKQDGQIDFTKSAHEINCLIRGLNIWPVAHTYVNGMRLKIYAADELCCDKGSCGDIITQDGEIIVKCGGDTAIRITDLQLEGSKRMSAKDFLNGRRMDAEHL